MISKLKQDKNLLIGTQHQLSKLNVDYIKISVKKSSILPSNNSKLEYENL